MNKMQLVNGVLTAQENTAIAQFSTQYQIEETLTRDLFLLVKSKGTRLMSRRTVTKAIRTAHIKHKLDISEEVNRRYKFLRTLAKIPVFPLMCKMVDTHSVEDAVDRLLNLLRAAYKRHTKSACFSCAMHSQCSYGQYVTAENKSGKTQGTPHKECPVYPQDISEPADANTEKLQQGAELIEAVVNPVFAGVTKMKEKLLVAVIRWFSGCGKDPVYDTTFTGSYAMDELDRIVQSLTERELIMFQVARTFDSSIAKTRDGDLVKSEAPDADKRPTRMDNINQITNATPTSQALPSILRNYRIGTKQMTVVESRKPESKKPLMYVQVDSSGSMTLGVAPNRFAFLTKGDMASALTLACIKKALEEQSMIYIRFFAGDVSRLHKGKTVEDFAHLSRKVAQCDFNGGSTDITRALTVAFEDIQKGKDEISKSEVLLISDGEDNLKIAEVEGAKKKTKLHTLQLVTGRRSRYQHNYSGVGQLKKLSDTFVEVDPDTVDFERVASVV